MIKKISTTYVKNDEIEFIVDDDPEFGWISSFESQKFDRFFVVIDKNVKKIWGEQINLQLKKHNKEIFFFEVEASEKSKSTLFYPELIDFFEKNRCGLSDLVIAFGGGVIIDLVSFSCSTYMRGLPLYIIATTLIGQIDASSAGKTCLNTQNTKNLLGTFYYPLKVYNNINFLKTNAPYYSRQGWSEIFKYGLLGSRKLLEMTAEYFSNPDKNLLMEIIELATRIRIDIKNKNPLASNLGHTFGHALEKISNFEILHGDAITIGTIISLYFSKKVGLMQEEKINDILNKMKELKLNIFLDKNIDIDSMLEVMMHDKKSSSKNLNLVLIKGIAEPYEKEGCPFYKTDPEFVKNFLKEFMTFYPDIIANCPFVLKKDVIPYSMITSVNHLSFTVADVEKSVEFYKNLLGLDLMNLSERDIAFSEKVTGIPGAHLKIAYLNGNNCSIELIQYLSPRGEKINDLQK
ncbi:MAG: iron-containing alcohol dehydrogenase [Candidatus Pacearchaeota archaeon]|nr:iron-containing alcohol dehydrogenase [Candidatus Pacearchaeota archaeon]